MARKKNKRNASAAPQAFVFASSCILQRVPPQIFGEQVLRLLTLRDICQIDIAISDRKLRPHWWLDAKSRKGACALTDVCLRYAIDPDEPLVVRNDDQVRWMQRRQITSSSLHVDASKVAAIYFRKLLAIPLRGQVESLVVKNLAKIEKYNAYLEAISACQNLRALDIRCDLDHLSSAVDDGYIHFIVDNNLALRTVSLHGKAIWDFLPYLHNASTLRHLHLHGFSKKQEGHENFDLEDLVTVCATIQLESFSMVNFCDCCSDALLDLFADLAFPSLRHVNISQAQRRGDITVDDEMIYSIADGCLLLETLDISQAWSGLVTDASIVYLAEHCPGLRSINLKGHSLIAIVSVEALLLHCLAIRYIGCYHTDIYEEDAFDLIQGVCNRKLAWDQGEFVLTV